MSPDTPAPAGRTLIAYASKSGVTAESAGIIAEVLRAKHGRAVDVVDLGENKKPDVTPCNSIFVGSGIRIGMWYGRARGFLRRRDLSDRKVAIFLSSCRAGNPAEYDKARHNYIERVVRKSGHLDIIAAEAFGGRYTRRGEVITDNYRPDKVREWADEVGRKLGE